ncbi:MAG: SOS response regulatory protein OraA/RecX [Oleiphilaceae bacterium]|jgi:SOS response regulatory protein OraA/RecX
MFLILNLEKLTESEVRSKLRKHSFELPKNFDFKQHTELTFCTKKRKITNVIKKIHR